MSQQTAIEDIFNDIEVLLQKKKEQHRGMEPAWEGMELRELLSEELLSHTEQLRSMSLADINLVGVASSTPVLGRIKTILKRAIRKSTFWLYQPLFQRISLFHHSVQVILQRMLTAMDTDYYEMDKKMAMLNRKLVLMEHKTGDVVQELTKDFQAVNQRLQDEITSLKKDVKGYMFESALLRARLIEALEGGTAMDKPTGQVSDHALDQALLSQLESAYLAFEHRFRGAESDIKGRLQIYMEDIEAASKNCGGYVLDMGCGRGEFLELCREREIEARGVDLNKAMVEHCRQRGLNVSFEDGIAHLKSLPDNSLCAFTAFQVVEHLSYENLWSLLNIVLLKLKPGGLVLLETVNPDSLVPLKNFFVDPTHVKPLPSITLSFAVEMAGFKDTKVKCSSPIDQRFLLQGDDENTRKLNDLLFGFVDYSVMGWK